MPATRTVRPERVFCPDSLDRALLDAAAGGPGHHLPVLGRRGELAAGPRWETLADMAAAEAIAPEDVGAIDADEVARWIVERYPGHDHPAVVLGSPHGSAVHLAAGLGGPWLPTGFVVRVPWSGGGPGDWPGAAAAGLPIAGRILANNPGVTVRQVHDPLRDGALCGTTLTLHVRWKHLPEAYTRLLNGRATLLLRDLRTWPVQELSRDHSMQVGSPVGGWSHADYDAGAPAFRTLLADLGAERWLRPAQDVPSQYAERGGEPSLVADLRRLADDTGGTARRVLYAAPDLLSACVADLYREHLRATLGSAESCLVETGRMVAPQQVLDRGVVPYWCESAAARTVAAAEWWLAGNDPFDQVTVLPEPPGTNCDAHAGLRLWRSLTSFARQHGHLDEHSARRYPRLPLARNHLTQVLGPLGADGQSVPPMTMDQVTAGLRRGGILIG
jgi:hypothetical protein